MRAGKLRHRVTIQYLANGSPQKTQMGAQVQEWATYHTCWADVRPLSGRELFLAQQADSRVETEIEIRYKDGVCAGMRVVASGVNYQVEAVIDPETRHIRQILRCSTGLINNG